MPLFAATVFLSAFLLFLVQPLIGRVLLPWFGGAPAVWTTCMLFFQVLLLAGYLWAHLLMRLGARRQARAHGALLLLAAAALGLGLARWGSPLIPDASLKPADSLQPTLRVLALLAQTVGLPYLALSATGPLLQAWFARVHPGRPAYRLYALSNAGSLLALLLYPFVLEPALPLRGQGWLFAAGFVLFAIGGGLVAARAGRAPARLPESLAAGGPTSPPRPGRWALWVGLAACPSWMLLAVTNHLSQEVAVVPFLWVVPLATYLLTFILTFESDRWYRPRLFVPALAVLLFVGALLLFGEQTGELAVLIAVFDLLLFAVGMVCHGELARRRPAPAQLTSFYLAVSVGGALGGLVVGAVAPALFDGYRELGIGLVLTWALTLISLARSLPRRRLAAAGGLAVLAALVASVVVHLRAPVPGRVAQVRGFYGVLRVAERTDPGSGARVTSMTHGQTVHGYQFREGPLRREPLAYYSRNSGVGRAVASHPRRGRGEPLRIGVVGLGVGILAAYGRAGDELRFYEINPDVIRLAQDPALFTYLADSEARVETVLGDARILLEREQAAGAPGFDLLVVDAFSSDAIPAHLLTREAFALYRDRLRDAESLLALHCSNRTLDLAPVMARAGAAVGLSAAELFTQPPEGEGTRTETPAHWLLLAQDPRLLEGPAFVGEARVRRTEPPPRLWTDDYTNVLSALGSYADE